MIDTLFDRIDLPPGLDARPYGFTWGGKDAHLAPTRDTPFKRGLLGKTNCALLLIPAASLIWAAKRISGAADVTKMLQVAQAELCFQASALYWNRDSPMFFTREGMGVGESIVETLAMRGTTDFRRSPGDQHSLPPLQDVANVVAITRHVLDPTHEPGYLDWLRALIGRLDVIAPSPEQSLSDPPRHDDPGYPAHKRALIGQPLPPEAANMARPFDPAERATLYSAFLRQVDWASNPYLNPPDKMKALGFDAEPYQ